ncbi:hypothetical protein NTJ24_003277 [Yersinia ruckeri]|nr:hypothetical protein [Yersinia ruckeri]EKN4692873.1 hypothetical protein [Yersinia ruckeri]EKN4696761.1 hypothetical protein [Yersinia ruckeri]
METEIILPVDPVISTAPPMIGMSACKFSEMTSFFVVDVRKHKSTGPSVDFLAFGSNSISSLMDIYFLCSE